MARILVVDDDASIRLVVRSILERQGHAVVLAESGRHGSEAIEAFSFDLAIIDIFMPDMDGLETIKALRKSLPTLPIIVMSGYAFRSVDGPPPDFFRMAMELGASACLRKPFTPAQLMHVVQTCREPADLTERKAAAPRHSAGSSRSMT
jgi:CheY-like chemotaxis protein